jgi:hypothetical protein
MILALASGVQQTGRPKVVRRAAVTGTPSSGARAARGILENGHSQEQAPGNTPENLASPVATAAELTPGNMELPTDYSCPGGRAAVTRPVMTSGTRL